jgi:hypothetical protein
VSLWWLSGFWGGHVLLGFLRWARALLLGRAFAKRRGCVAAVHWHHACCDCVGSVLIAHAAAGGCRAVLCCA